MKTISRRATKRLENLSTFTVRRCLNFVKQVGQQNNKIWTQTFHERLKIFFPTSESKFVLKRYRKICYNWGALG